MVISSYDVIGSSYTNSLQVVLVWDEIPYSREYGSRLFYDRENFCPGKYCKIFGNSSNFPGLWYNAGNLLTGKIWGNF